jgi:hypothetical protein
VTPERRLLADEAAIGRPDEVASGDARRHPASRRIPHIHEDAKIFLLAVVVPNDLRLKNERTAVRSLHRAMLRLLPFECQEVIE